MAGRLKVSGWWLDVGNERLETGDWRLLGCIHKSSGCIFFGAMGLVPQGDATRCLMRMAACIWSRSFFAMCA